LCFSHYPKKIGDIGGYGLLAKYKNSLYSMLTSIYPEHTWNRAKLNRTPKKLWENDQRKFIQYAEAELTIKELSDWYKVTGKV
jgi:hypothetical protein